MEAAQWHELPGIAIVFPNAPTATSDKGQKPVVGALDPSVKTPWRQSRDYYMTLFRASPISGNLNLGGCARRVCRRELESSDGHHPDD
jgi:hypothetical protein